MIVFTSPESPVLFTPPSEIEVRNVSYFAGLADTILIAQADNADIFAAPVADAHPDLKLLLKDCLNDLAMQLAQMNDPVPAAISPLIEVPKQSQEPIAELPAETSAVLTLYQPESEPTGEIIAEEAPALASAPQPLATEESLAFIKALTDLMNSENHDSTLAERCADEAGRTVRPGSQRALFRHAEISAATIFNRQYSADEVCPWVEIRSDLIQNRPDPNTPRRGALGWISKRLKPAAL